MSSPPARRRLSATGRRTRPRFLAVLAACGLLVLVALLVEGFVEPAQPGAAAALAQGPAPAGAWYCPVPAGDGETATLSVAAAGDEPATVTVVHATGDGPVADPPVEVASGSSLELPLDAAAAAAPVTVRWRGGPTVATWRVEGRETAAAACADGPAPLWYVSGLDTAEGTRSTLHLFNPFAEDAVARVTYATPGGPVALVLSDTLLVGAGQSLPVDLGQFQPEEPVLGAVVEVRSGRLVVQGEVVYQPFEGEGGPRGRTLVPAAPAPAGEWAFAFARADAGSSSWLSVQNPTDRAAAVEVRVSEPLAETTLLEEVAVPAGGMTRIDLGQASAQQEFGVALSAVNEVPVVVTRTTALTTGDGRPGVATSLGATAETQWALAGGGTQGRSGRIGLYNPGASAVTVDLTTGGRSPQGWAGVEVPPNGRATIELDGAGEVRADIPVRVRADGPILPELRSLALGSALRLWTAVGTPASSWRGPTSRPPVRRDPALSTAPLVAVPSPVPGSSPAAAAPSPSPAAQPS